MRGRNHDLRVDSFERRMICSTAVVVVVVVRSSGGRGILEGFRERVVFVLRVEKEVLVFHV